MSDEATDEASDETRVDRDAAGLRERLLAIEALALRALTDDGQGATKALVDILAIASPDTKGIDHA